MSVSKSVIGAKSEVYHETEDDVRKDSHGGRRIDRSLRYLRICAFGVGVAMVPHR